MLTVSVVIPVKNDADALRRCLDALNRQSRLPDEIVVVNNASTDDTADVADAAGARAFWQAEPGIPAASTMGYDAARYDIICRLDADSIPAPDWIANGLQILIANPSTAAVTGPGDFYDGPRHGSGLLARLYLGAYFSAFRLALGTTPLFGSNFFLRRTAWLSVTDSVHRSGLNLHDDLDLTIHLTPDCTIVYDESNPVGISFRPFRQRRTVGLRVKRGFVTLANNWPRS